jgi:hypothetical protein
MEGEDMEQTNPMKDVIVKTAYYAAIGLLVEISRRTVDSVFKNLK